MTTAVALISDIKTWMRGQNLKLNESKAEIMQIKGNLRTITKVAHEFGNLDVEASKLAPVNTARNLGICFDLQLSFKCKLIQ